MDDMWSIIKSGDIQAGLDHFASLPAEQRRGFLEQVGSVKDNNAARLLSALFPTLDQKDLKKLVKKLLFHLKTQGVQVDEPVVSGDSALKKVEVARDQIALVSNYDHEGIRVVLLAFEMRKKQFIFTHVTQHFGEGLADMMSAPIDKQGLDGLIRDYRTRTRSSMVLVDVSPRYALYLIEEASTTSGKQTEEIKGLKRLATGLKGDIKTPADIYTLQPPLSGPEVSWQQVVSGASFEPFTLSWKGLEEDRKEFHSIVNPQIVLPPYVVEEKKTAYLKELAALDRMRPLQLHLSRMLEDYAYLFYCRGEYAGYAALVSVLQSTDTLDALMQFFLKKSLGQKEKEQQQQAPGLIVDPYTRKP